MGAFWDERARENAAYFVDNELDYNDSDLERFWAGGAVVVDGFAEQLGFTIGADEDLVEIGCGIGRLTRELAARARSVVAFDVSPEMLARARAHNSELAGVDWRQTEGSTLTGVADASIDGVFSHVVFQHVPDPEITYSYVREMGRVLRPGGWAAFHVSNLPEVHARRPTLGHRVAAVFGRAPKGSDHPAWRGSAVDLDVLRSTADQAGLKVAKTVGDGTQFCLVRLTRL